MSVNVMYKSALVGHKFNYIGKRIIRDVVGILHYQEHIFTISFNAHRIRTRDDEVWFAEKRASVKSRCWWFYCAVSPGCSLFYPGADECDLFIAENIFSQEMRIRRISRP